MFDSPVKSSVLAYSTRRETSIVSPSRKLSALITKGVCLSFDFSAAVHFTEIGHCSFSGYKNFSFSTTVFKLESKSWKE